MTLGAMSRHTFGRPWQTTREGRQHLGITNSSIDVPSLDEALGRLQSAPIEWADEEVETSRPSGSNHQFTACHGDDAMGRHISHCGGRDSSRTTLAAESPIDCDLGRRGTSKYSEEARHCAQNPRNMNHGHVSCDAPFGMIAEDASASSSTDSSTPYSTLHKDHVGSGRESKANLPRRSIQSLRYIARACTSYTTGSARQTRDGSQHDVHPSQNHLQREKRPVRLDRRRLDRAVSLAIEAAQAVEEDERIWRQKHLQRSRIAASAPSSGRSSPRLGPIASLPWPRRKKASDPAATPGGGAGSTPLQSLDPLIRGKYADGDDEDDVDVIDDFSTELYVSSLGYLLSALRPEDASAMPVEQREQLTLRLRQALAEVDGDQASRRDTVTHEEQVLMMQVRHDSLGDHTIVSRPIAGGKRQTLLQSQEEDALGASDTVAPISRTMAGSVASSALDLGLNVGAGLIAAASRSISLLIPKLDADEPQARSELVHAEFSEDDSDAAITRRDGAVSNKGQKYPATPSSAQWELTRTLANSIATTMYNQLAAAARDPTTASQERALVQRSEEILPSSDVDDPAERLMLVSASLARSVKRSPLPTQVRTLASQVVSLAGAIDRKYSITQRSADIALRKTGEALSYVRKNDLHVKAIRIAWNVVEASVVAMEAYRSEEGWREPGARPRSRSLPSDDVKAPRLASG